MSGKIELVENTKEEQSEPRKRKAHLSKVQAQVTAVERLENRLTMGQTIGRAPLAPAPKHFVNCELRRAV